MIIEGYYSCKKLFSKDGIVPLNGKCYSANVAIVPINGIMQEIGGDKMSLEKLSKKYNEKFGNIKTVDDLIQKFSPWEGEEFKNILDSFKDGIKSNSTTFSWVDVDKKLTKIEKNKYVRFGIPNHIHGDIENARLFLCLINPNIGVVKGKKRNEGIRNFYQKAKLVSGSDESLDILGTDDNLKIKDTDIKNHIINTSAESSILLKELDMLEKRLRQIKENEGSADKKLSEKELIERKKVIQGEAYYLTHYFANICMAHLGIDQKVKTFAVELDDLTELKNMSKYIANLEAYPFRSKNPNFKFTEAESKVSMFSARIIIWRICKAIIESKEQDDKENLRPIFLFRRFNDGWKPSIMNVLTVDLGFSSDEAEDIVEELLQTYFLTIQKIDYKNTTSSIGRESLYIRKVNEESKNIENKNIKTTEFNKRFSKLFS